MQKKSVKKPTKKTPPKKTPPKKKKTTGAKTQKEHLKNYKIKYELKIIGLIAFTLFLMLCLYTSAVGALGIWVKEVLFGFFSYVAYVMPPVVFAFVFVRLNPNFKPAVKRITIGTTLVLVGMVLAATLIQYQDDYRQLLNTTPFYTFEHLKTVYQSGVAYEGGGVFGEMLTYAFLKAVGFAGTVLFILVAFIAGFIVFTKVSLQELWEHKRQQMLSKRAEKAASREEMETLLKQEKEAERLMLESMQAEKALEEVKTTVKKKTTPSKENDSTQFLAKLDLAKKASRKKDVKVFDYDYYEGKETVKETPSQEPVETPISRDPLPSEPAVVEPAEAEPAPVPQEAFEETEAIRAPETPAVETPPQEPAKKAQKQADEEVVDEAQVQEEIESGSKRVVPEYVLPPMGLLADPKGGAASEDRSEFMKMAKRLEETLQNFNVDASVVSVKQGPSITMFEVQLSPGIKVSKVVGLSEDIALNLATSQVRIAPIPGKTAIGIEVPNKTKSMVVMKEVLESEAFKQSSSKLSVGLGKDISGNPIIGDLASMPHLLIAGATGSGKSVCVNTIISSILLNAKPDEVKFLMIDPKVVELSNYNGIPHLILPVVTDSKKAAIALNWAVNEMTRRYKLFADSSSRDMKGYNKKAEKTGEELLPQIVVIIDELADLMMVAPNQVEDAICRLAQMARAAGIHLIVATQRPSVDVITGLIKANIPSRIAFSVSSAVDSRTIIDMGGAEKLLGKGDMLYYPVGASKPKRAQGAFMSDEEVEGLVTFIKEQSIEVQYREEILDEVPKGVAEGQEVDEYLEQAIEFVVTSEQASASLLQRRFRVGYNRAARLIEAMEERGIVGPPRGSKPREVLITAEALNEAPDEAAVAEETAVEATVEATTVQENELES
ncbi:DNA translocase FtsK 4TM domain-containing protein [Fusibacter sp. JL298sf-3]